MSTQSQPTNCRDGHSGNVPGAIRPGDLPDMLQKLKDGLERLSPEEDAAESAPGNNQGERPVPLSVRAGPLVELIESAIENEDHVMWE